MPKISTIATPAAATILKNGANSLDSKEYLIEGGRIWNGLDDVSSALAASVWVRGGRIEAVGRRADQGFRGALRRDVSGHFLIPGLIDAHVHLELDPELRTPAEQLALAPDVVIDAMARRAQEMLFAGITTTRDCGGGSHREHDLRAGIDGGHVIGPRILCCGQPLTSPGGHCHFWGGEVSSRLDIDTVLARQIEAGSDWIKVMATGGVFTPGSRARDTQFEIGRLVSIVDAAARAGRSVAAHCHGTHGIADAVRAGVRTIEHASFAGAHGFGTELDESLMREIARAEAWVSPTVNAGWGRRIENAEGAPTDFFSRMSQCLQRQRDAGVRFIASTDAGIPGVAHHDLVAGLEAFARYADLTEVDVLRSATSEAARALGVENETGRIEAGFSADMLLLSEDPLVSLAPLRDPEAVVFRGLWMDREARRRGSANA
jgi:imidazolonepropionase-like amidohydrolase